MGGGVGNTEGGGKMGYTWRVACNSKGRKEGPRQDLKQKRPEGGASEPGRNWELSVSISLSARKNRKRNRGAEYIAQLRSSADGGREVQSSSKKAGDRNLVVK